jgi:4-amino-4-deoxy-L-arabinose transferase-like glycosyltransferase
VAELAQDLQGPTLGTLTASHARARSGLWASLRALPLARQYLLVLLLAFTVKQAFQVILYPPFTGHDEVAHFDYIRTVADEYRVPIIPNLEQWRDNWRTPGAEIEGDFLSLDLYRYQRYALDWCCGPRDDGGRWREEPPKAMTLLGDLYPNGWQYVANHPPLYYLLMTPVYKATSFASLEVQQYALRAAAIPLGMAVVLLAFLMMQALAPRDAFLQTTVPTVVAFQPQVSYEGAMVNNDILSIALFTLILYLLVRGIMTGFTLPRSLVLGLVLGLGLLTKATLLTAVPLIALAIIASVGWRSARQWLLYGAAAGGVAGLVAAPWYVYLYRTYGDLDGLTRVRALQYAWAYDPGEAPSMWELFWNWTFAQERWRETWGEFGWRLIHLDEGLLAALAVICGIFLLGFFLFLGVQAYGRVRVAREGEAPSDLFDGRQTRVVLLMAAAAIIAYAAVLQFGTQFMLTQARYYFHAIVPLAFVLMLGLRQLLPVRARPYGAATVLLLMVALNLVIFTQYVIPYWYLGS